MKTIRSLIVDDEPLARGRVRMLLEEHPDFEIVGEAGNGEEALERIRELEPDLLFLDIQMPGVSGLELLETLSSEARPHAVFLTAYDEYAVDAFDAAALDYVLKPIEPQRFARALDRVRQTFGSESERKNAQAAVERLLSTLSSDRPRRFVVRKAKGRRILVAAETIQWVTAERNYVRLHTDSGSHLLRETMSKMEERLDPHAFARIHRSAIIRIEAIREIDTEADGSYFVTMQSGERLSVGAAYRDNLERALGDRL